MLAIFGIDNDLISLGVSLVLLVAIVFWLGLVAFTFLDARRRIEDPFLIICATIAAFIFPFIGVIVYTMLRPPEFIEDARERDLEIRATELRVAHLIEASCPNCEFPIDRSYLRCPRCRARIKEPCDGCSKPIDPRWAICPYCETPNRRVAARRVRDESEREPARRGLRRKRPEEQATEADSTSPPPPPRRREQPQPASSRSAAASERPRSSRSGSSGSSSSSQTSSRKPASKSSAPSSEQATRAQASEPSPRRRPRPAGTPGDSAGGRGSSDSADS